MVENETFQQWKLMSLEAPMDKALKFVIVMGTCIVTTIILYNYWSIPNCTMKQLVVMDDKNRYQESLDPEICDDLLNKIIKLNDECGIELEPVDCG